VLGDRYRLERPIAAGGIGQVWRAYDQALDRQVAVKLLRPEYAEHPETLERFRSEARNAGALSHPNIAHVYDYRHSGLSRGPYLVMEYVDGPSLADLIEVEPLPIGLTCDVIAQAASALDAAHKAGLVHRDIKPANMLLAADGRLKITDFGIAHAAGSAPITAPGIVVGTSLYMAPERIAGEAATPASDLYSLGIVMWECLVGRPPFSGSSVDVMAAHLHQAMPPLPGWVPGPLCDFIGRLTAKDPGYRASDAGRLARDARTLALVSAGRAHEPGSDPGPPTPGRGRPGTDPVACAAAASLPALEPADATDGYPAAAGTTGALAPAGRGQGGRRQRGAMIAVAAVAAAALATMALVAAHGLVSGAAPAAPVASAASARAADAASGRPSSAVLVPASLAGQPVGRVTRWLRAHALNYRITYAAGTGQPSGTVISVTPEAVVSPGTTITVTVALGSGPASTGAAGQPEGGHGTHAAPDGTRPSRPASSGPASPASPAAGATPAPGLSGGSSPSPGPSPTGSPDCLLGIVCP